MLQITNRPSARPPAVVTATAVTRRLHAQQRVTAFIPQPPESLIAVGQLTKANPYIQGVKDDTYRTGFYALYSGRFRTGSHWRYWILYDAIWLGVMRAKGVLSDGLEFRKYDGFLRSKFRKALRVLGAQRSTFIAENMPHHVLVRKHNGDTDDQCFYEAVVPVSVMNLQLMNLAVAALTKNLGPDGQDVFSDPLDDVSQKGADGEPEDDPNVIDMEPADKPEGTDEGDEGGSSGEGEGEPTEKKPATDVTKFQTGDPNPDGNGGPDPTHRVLGAFTPNQLDAWIAAAPSSMVPPALWRELKTVVKQIKLVSLGGTSVMMLHLHLDKTLSQQLLAADFRSSSPADLHGLLRNWVATGINGLTKNRRPARYILSLPKIRSIAPTEGRRDIRINEAGIAVSPSGQLYWLPTEYDRINEYTSAVNTYLDNNDGEGKFSSTYGTVNKTGVSGEFTAKPPLPSQLVYMDWVNQKVAYNPSDGHLSFISTDRFVPATTSHYANVLRRSIHDHSLQNTLSLIYSLGLSQNLVPGGTRLPDSWKALVNDVLVDAGTTLEGDAARFRLIDFLQADSIWVTYFHQIADALAERIANDPDGAYQRYSVPNVLRMRGLLHLIVTYASDYESVIAQDREQRGKYLDQKVPEGFDGIEVPFARADPDNPLFIFGHQNKAQGLLSTRPDNAVLSIDAGGGKTNQSLYDILGEMKAGTIKRPIILCPNHLVATHIKDGVEFTGGQVNFIPITTAVLRRHGLKGIQKFLMRRPPNTIVVAGFSVISRKHQINYGTEATTIYYVADFLRHFDFDMCVVDESHKAKNDSTTQRAVHRVMSMCKKKRIMSGTLAPNNIVDLVMQFALIDPTVFGSIEDFKRKYAEEYSGDKVVRWKPGTEAEVSRLIKGNSVYIRCQRKEWAALLPEKVERIINVRLNQAQMEVYQSIMAQAFDAMPTEQRKKLQLLLEQSARIGTKDERPGDADIDEDKIISDIEALMAMYLARVEQFCVAPGSDLAGQALSQEDQLSPKVTKVADCCREHLAGGYQGKILVFTNYIASATAIYEYLDSLPEFKGRVIHYRSSDKEAGKSQFEFDDTKLIMVGVGSSMDTGLNLQHASRLIRVEGVWSPGIVEQGDARIHRPVVTKDGDKREFVFIDTILALGTVDITKWALFVSKMISIEKFRNEGNPLYDDLNVPDTMKMTAENILSFNDENTIRQYYEDYQAYVSARKQDYLNYKESHPEGITRHAVKRSAPIADAKIMLRVPYLPEISLYKAKDLGLIRYDHAANLDEEELRKTLPGENGGSVSPEGEVDTSEKAKFLWQGVHTEYGDGTIVKISKSELTVELGTGTTVKVHKLEAFLIDRTKTNSHDMKKYLVQNTTDIELDEEPEVPVRNDSPARARKSAQQRRAERAAEREARRAEKEALKQEQETNKIDLELGFEIVNGTIGLRVYNNEDPGVMETLQQYQFRTMPIVYYAKLERPEQFLSLLWAWKEEGFDVSDELKDGLFDYYALFRRFFKRLKDINPHNYVNRTAIQLFFRQTFKTPKNPKEIKPYPWLKDGEFYIAMPLTGQPGTIPAARVGTTKLAQVRVVPDPLQPDREIRISGRPLKWLKTKGDELMYLGTKSEHLTKLKQLMNSGYRIVNIEEVKQEFKQLRIIPGSRRETPR